jgi:hypothetical protein
LDLDATLVRQSLIEGAATALMDDFVSEEIRAGRASVALVEKVASTGVRGASAMPGVAPYLRLRLWMPYAAGAVFVGAGREDSSPESLAAACKRGFEEPPRSMSELLHPWDYWNEENASQPAELRTADIAIDLDPVWSLVGEGTLGEPVVSTLGGTTTPVGGFDLLSHAAASWTNVVGRGWRADRWQLYQAGDASIVILYTRWATEADAKEFVALSDIAGRSTMLRSGTLVVLAVGEGDAPTSAAAAAALHQAER